VTTFSFETEAIKVGEDDVWNSWEKFIDLGDGIWNEGEPLEDELNGTWDEGELFDDLGNEVYDEGEPFFDKDSTKYHRNLTWSPTIESNKNFIKYILYRTDEPSHLISPESCNCEIAQLSLLSNSTYIDSSSEVIDKSGHAAFYYSIQVLADNFTRNSFIYNYTEFNQPGPIQLTGENVSTDKDEFIEITWNPITTNSDYFYQYEIWRSSNEELSDQALIAIIIDPEQGKFMDRTAGNGTTWYYSVVVRDINGRISAKNFVSGWSMP
jgi:hypothetical protein